MIREAGVIALHNCASNNNQVEERSSLRFDFFYAAPFSLSVVSLAFLITFRVYAKKKEKKREKKRREEIEKEDDIGR